MKVSLKWVKDYVKVQGESLDLADKLTMAGLEVKKIEKIQEDSIFETEITTNRADWLSHVGVARELHAITGAKFSLPESKFFKTKSTIRQFKAAIAKADLDLCPYYSACLLENVEWSETPSFMKERLESCGIRSINFPVDVTNYVLLESGQPLHAFDADRLKGNTISARRGQKDEQFVAIDSNIYKLEPNDVVIADEKGAIALGGVMGGKDSEVSDSTKNILLESAFFSPSAVRRTSRRLKLISESSYRFERRVDPGMVNQARDRAIYLFQKYAKVERIGNVCASGKLPVKNIVVHLPAADIKRILGKEISISQAAVYLKRLGLKVTKNSSSIRTIPPSFRPDITQSVDLIEEIARLDGYSKIPDRLPEIIPMIPQKNSSLLMKERIHDLAVGMGFYEAVNFSLIHPGSLEAIIKETTANDYFGFNSEKWVRLKNPQHKEWTLMRPNLLLGLLNNVRHNYHAGESTVRLFEVSNRYEKSGSEDLPREEQMAAFVISGQWRVNWLERKRDATFYDLKGFLAEFLLSLGLQSHEAQRYDGSIFEPEEGLQITFNGKCIGYFGTISKAITKQFDIERPVFYAELSVQLLAEFKSSVKTVQELSKFPPSPRDLTLILPDEVKAKQIIQKICEVGKDLIQHVEVFDLFKGGKIPQDKKSVSFRIVYQSKTRTLQNDEVNVLHFSIVDIIAQEFGAELPKNS